MHVVRDRRHDGERGRSPNGWRASSPSAALDACSTIATSARACKFADAELIGAPVRITVGKRTASEGTVDVQLRKGREQHGEAAGTVAESVAGLLA